MESIRVYSRAGFEYQRIRTWSNGWTLIICGDIHFLVTLGEVVEITFIR